MVSLQDKLEIPFMDTEKPVLDLQQLCRKVDIQNKRSHAHSHIHYFVMCALLLLIIKFYL